MEIDIEKLKEINRQFIEASKRGDVMLCLKLQMQFEYLLPKKLRSGVIDFIKGDKTE